MIGLWEFFGKCDTIQLMFNLESKFVMESYGNYCFAFGDWVMFLDDSDVPDTGVVISNDNDPIVVRWDSNNEVSIPFIEFLYKIEGADVFVSDHPLQTYKQYRQEYLKRVLSQPNL